jgi:hypothetical protein
MAHFAKVNNNIVEQVIVVNDNDCLDQYGNESDVIGSLFCHNLLGGHWIQTSFNNKIRKQFAGIGYTYDPNADVFIAPQPFPSWSLDANHDWQPPIPQPEPKELYSWNEEELEWRYNGNL